MTADHGESFSHDYYFNHRAGLWDEVTHVPLIIGGGGLKGTRVSEQVGLIDILPTVLDIAKLPGDNRFMGTSRVDWIAGESLATACSGIFDYRSMDARASVCCANRGVQVDQRCQQDWVYHLTTDPTESTNVKVNSQSTDHCKRDVPILVEGHVKWQTDRVHESDKYLMKNAKD